MSIATMSEFFLLWEKHIVKTNNVDEINYHVLAGFQILTRKLPTKIVSISGAFFCSFHDIVNIYIRSIATPLAVQVAAFVCTNFPGYILSVEELQDPTFSSINIYYVNFSGEMPLPTPSKETSELSASLTMESFIPYDFSKRTLYMSPLVFFRYRKGCQMMVNRLDEYITLHQLGYSMSKEIDRLEFVCRRGNEIGLRSSCVYANYPLFKEDMTTYVNLRWKCIWSLLLWVFYRDDHPLNNKDLIREIGAFF